MHTSLSLPESFLLLALDDNKGSWLIASGALYFGLAGAILQELLAGGHIKLEEDNVEILERPDPDQKTLTKALATIRDSKKSADLRHWLTKLSQHGKHYCKGYLDSLTARDILQMETKKILWFIPTKKFVAMRMGPEQDVRNRLRAVVKGYEQPAQRDIQMLSLAYNCGLLKPVFPEKEERKAIRKKLKTLLHDEPVGKKMGAMIEETEVFSALTAGLGGTFTYNS